MAINSIDVTGTTVTANGALVGCLQSIGNLEETRNVTSYSCIDSDESTKALGAIERGSLDLSVFNDPDDIEGLNELRTAFETNAEIPVVIELNNTLGVNGTQYEFTAKVSKYSIGFPKDEKVTIDFTVEISSVITETAAA